MERKTEYPHIKVLIEKLSKESEEFEKQLDDVKKRYPLVALAYGLHKCMIKDLSECRLNEETHIEASYFALTKEKPYIDAGIQFEQRMQKLDHCLGVAGMTSYIDIGHCLTKYL